jgi:uncharacterized protein (TIGR03435 family)
MAVARGFSFAGLILFPLLVSGQEAPPLQVGQWLQAPVGFGGQWSGLRNKVVVLEFWATWCPPCIDAIPHLNQLAREFRDQGVVFLAITDDDIDRLKPFLAKQPINAIIGLDPERRNWKAFDVPSIPHTVLIGKDGSIIGATFPENITAGVLQEALASKKPALPAKEGVPSDLEWDDHSIAWQDGVAPAMYAIIKPIKTTTSGVWPRPGHITADGVPLEVLVQIAYQTDHYHIDWRMPKDDKVYRAAFRVPEQQADRLLCYLQHTLADLFGIQARWTAQERDVYVLRRIEGHPALPESRSERELVQSMRGKITLRRQPVGKLCQFLTNSFGAVVMDETGLEGRYDFDVSYQSGRLDVLTKGLHDIGLDTVKARRNIQILVVTPDGAGPGKKP